MFLVLISGVGKLVCGTWIHMFINCLLIISFENHSNSHRVHLHGMIANLDDLLVQILGLILWKFVVVDISYLIYLLVDSKCITFILMEVHPWKFYPCKNKFCSFTLP